MKQVTIPAQWLQELIALCGPEDHELRERVMKSAAQAPVDALATGGQAQAVDIAELVTGMSVSVDVSTGDDDAGNRYFGTVTVAQEDPHDKHGLTLLVQDAKPNFTPQAQEDARDARLGTARAFIEWAKAQPEDRAHTTIDGALAEFEAHIAAIAAAKGDK